MLWRSETHKIPAIRIILKGNFKKEFGTILQKILNFKIKNLNFILSSLRCFFFETESQHVGSSTFRRFIWCLCVDGCVFISPYINGEIILCPSQLHYQQILQLPLKCLKYASIFLQFHIQPLPFYVFLLFAFRISATLLLFLKCHSYFFLPVSFVVKGHPLSYSKASLGVLILIKSKSPNMSSRFSCPCPILISQDCLFYCIFSSKNKFLAIFLVHVSAFQILKQKGILCSDFLIVKSQLVSSSP